MSKDYFSTKIAHHIWDTRYRYRSGDEIFDSTIIDTWRRVASTLTSIEQTGRDAWVKKFYSALEDFKFLPGGRILAGAGTARQVTLFNCFVMGIIEDSMDGIFDNLKEGALTMQQGGGVGYDFSTLRPQGTCARSTGTIASGPVSFMHIWDRMCATLLSTGARRGAMMATLRCDHPDIEAFISVKRDGHELRHFNLSVQVTDDFMHAVEQDEDWPLVFPATDVGDKSSVPPTIVRRRWTGCAGEVPCVVLRTVRAKALWDKLVRATYDYAEPGVLFVDRINGLNNLWYREMISATNPCGEIPLPPYGACDLGSINLTCFVQDPFTPEACLDFNEISNTAAIATRMMDNVIDLSLFPLARQAEQARGSRRIGLGIAGLGDTLIMLGLHYDSSAARNIAAKAMQVICHTSYRTSIQLAVEKGCFPFLDKEKFLEGEFIHTLPDDIRQGIADHGIRNSHVTAIAPTGTISLLANNISSGLEPVFDFHFRRRVLEGDGRYRYFDLTDYALDRWLKINEPGTALPDVFVDARKISPIAHLQMQASLQPFVDNAISKTVNVPENYNFADFQDLYHTAFKKGLKGCTTFRPNPITGAVLDAATGEALVEEGIQAPHCCSIEREAD